MTVSDPQMPRFRFTASRLCASRKFDDTWGGTLAVPLHRAAPSNCAKSPPVPLRGQRELLHTRQRVETGLRDLAAFVLHVFAEELLMRVVLVKVLRCEHR